MRFEVVAAARALLWHMNWLSSAITKGVAIFSSGIESLLQSTLLLASFRVLLGSFFQVGQHCLCLAIKFLSLTVL